MATRNARVILSATDKASKTVWNVHRALKGLGALAATIGAVALGRKLYQGVKESVDVFAQFDSQMSSTAAVLGKSRGEIAALEKQAKLLGRTTQFTARQSADAQFTFAKAGFSVNEIYSALPGTLNLAAAAEVSLGEAADISAGLVRGFNLEATATGDVADILATAANNANTTISEMAEGFKFVAPAATGLGVNLTETAAAMDVLSDNMLGGSIGGTGLRKVFTTLLGSVNKLEGATGLGGLQERFNELRENGASLHEILVFLRDEAGVNASNAYEIFGDRAGNVAKVLVENIDRFDELSATIKDRYGAALEVAQKKLDNLKGDQVKFKSALEGTQIIIGEGLNVGLRTLTQQLTTLTSTFNEAAESGEATADLLADINDSISRLGERAVKVADVVQISWAGLKVGFNAFAKLLTDSLGAIGRGYAKFLSMINVGGIFDLQIIKARAAAEELDMLSEGWAQSADDIWQAAITTSTNLNKVLNELVETRKSVAEKAAKAKAEADAAVAPEVEEGGLGSADVVGEPGPTKESPEDAEAKAKQLADIRTKAKQVELEHLKQMQAAAEADERARMEQRHAQELIDAQGNAKALAELRQAHAEERAALEFSQEQARLSERGAIYLAEMELMRLRHEEELAELEGNEVAKTELLAVHEDQRELLREEYRQKRLESERNLTDAELENEKNKAKAKKQLNKALFKEGMAVLGQLFGGSKAFAMADVIITTAQSVSRALSNPPGLPWTAPMGALAAAKGAAELAAIKKQKFKAQYGAVPGVTVGSGIDSMVGRFSPGELIADTTAEEARGLLGGRLAIVPAGQGAGGGNTYIIEGDVLDPDDYFRRHAQAVGRARETLDDDGEVL